MTSVEARDAVKQYELRHNVLLQSILPGGLLSSFELKERCDALLVPRQISLEVMHIAPYFLATARRPSFVSSTKAAPTLAALFGEKEDLPEQCSSSNQETEATGDAATTAVVTFPPEKTDAFRAALARFLEYHLLHFDSLGNSEFTNLSGQRGTFTEDLNHVQRFGHLGQVAVLAYADALRPKSSAIDTDGHAPAGGDCSRDPSSLQIFIIDMPLMDTGEVHLITDALHKLTKPATPQIEVNKSASPHKTSLVDIPFIMGDRNASDPTARLKPLTELFNLSAPSPNRVAAANATGPGGTDSGDESVAETVVIEDRGDEPPKSPVLEDYIEKYTHISKRQRQQSESNCASSAKAHNSGDGSFHDQIIDVPTPPTLLTSVCAHQGVAALTAGSSQLASSATDPKGTATATIIHANVLRHEYSRECIKDYRRVVAADNEIFYGEFERLMVLRCAGPLAKVINEYVSKNEHSHQPILNTNMYNKFVERCHTVLYQTHRLSMDKERLVIMQEGIERYVTSRLYHQIFNVCEEEKSQSKLLQEKLIRLEDMTPAHLHAFPEVEQHHVWGQAMFELDGMDFFKSPREKLRCGMRSCELLSLAVGDIIRQRRSPKQPGKAAETPALGNGGSVPLAFGADEFLPCFLLLVLRARPLSFVQNVLYIEKFRYPALMSAEESYCFATLQSSLLFWQNCRDDGQMDSACATDVSLGRVEAPPHNGGLGNSDAPCAVSSSLSGVMQPPQPPPLMTEHDLLPSVRQASLTARQQAAVDCNSRLTNGPDAPLSEGKPHAEETPTVLDVLFGWANRSLAPLASEIGLGARTSDKVGKVSTLGRETVGAESSVIPASGAIGYQSPLRGTVVSSTSAAPQAEVVRDESFSEGVSHAALAPSLPLPLPDSNVSSRARVRELLVTQNKLFDQLTLPELQMIVEEARQLLLEGR
ncbi:Vacuolar sorting protein 9 [Leishmania braziliensis]|nr:Vacuolar sorting protein 9 [Leishmania braziliensis]